MKYRLLAGVAACCVTNFTATSTGWAQTASQADPDMGEIIVTATRRETTLQATPLAVSAVSAEALTAKGVNGLGGRSVIAELGGADPLRVSWICPHWPDRSLVVLYRVSQRRTLH